MWKIEIVVAFLLNGTGGTTIENFISTVAGFGFIIYGFAAIGY